MNHLNYEGLLSEANANDIYVVENASFESQADGLINGNVIGLNKNIPTTTKKACILAEELGHYHTTTGNILDESKTSNRKQELRARLWAYNKLIGLQGIIKCHKANCHNINEMAEHLEVTEEFLKEAIDCYKSKYGTYTAVDNYIIVFEPRLYVIERFE